MAMKSIARELERRKNRKINRPSIIGTELRNIRLARSKTLSEVCDGAICLSYLSKIENGVVLPNRTVLKEACIKYNVSKDSIDTLIRMDELLEEALINFICCEYESLNKIHQRCIELTNFRASFIKILYNISIKNYRLAQNNISHLSSLLSTMSNYDLGCFVFLKAVLDFYTSNYAEAYRDLKNACDVIDNPVIIKCMRLYIFYCSYKLNNRNIYYDYTEVLNSFIYFGKFNILDNINYLYACNLIYNKMYDISFSVIEGINDITKKNTCSLYLKYEKGDYEPSMANVDDVTAFFKLFIIQKVRIDLLEKYIHDFEKCNDIELNLEYYKYFLKFDNEDKYNYIVDLFTSKRFKLFDGYFKRFIVSEFSRLTSENCKYKSFVMAFLDYESEGFL